MRIYFALLLKWQILEVAFYMLCFVIFIFVRISYQFWELPFYILYSVSCVLISFVKKCDFVDLPVYCVKTWKRIISFCVHFDFDNKFSDSNSQQLHNTNAPRMTCEKGLLTRKILSLHRYL